MKKVNQFLFGLALVAALVSISQAQNTATAGGSSSAGVIHRIKLTWEKPLEYGGIIISTGGHVDQDATGIGVNAITSSAVYPHASTNPDGGVTLTTVGHPSSLCTFLVEGEFNYTFAVTLPPIEIIVTPVHLIGPGVPDLTIDNFNTNLTGSDPISGGTAGSGNGGTGTLSTGGFGYKFFAVGARLYCPAGTPAGDYTGQFNVGVMYN